MASQLIYTKSRAVHGSLVQRICRAVRPGYAVVGKTRMSPALESKLVSLARNGIGKKGMDFEPQFFYLPDFTERGTQHIFGSIRWMKRGGVTSADYIAHFLVLTEEEVRGIWQSSCRLTPAGVLLVLELSGFWAESWRGAARWLTNENLPKWEESEEALQAQVQPTWQRYTGHKRFAALLKTPQYKEACMLAVPAGTPVTDMLRLLHEADFLRSDLGWSIPISTHSSEEFMDLAQVQLLGFIGGRMQRQATLSGIPVIEVTEKLVDEPTPQSSQPSPPPLVTTPQVEEKSFTISGEGHGTSAPQTKHLISKLLKTGEALLILGGVALCGYYVWHNRDELINQADDILAQVEKLNKAEQPQDVVPESTSQTRAEEPTIVEQESTTSEQKSVRRRIKPVLIGQTVPSFVKSLFNDTNSRIDIGTVTIYHLSPTESDRADSLSRELDGSAYYATISPGDAAGKWELRLLEQGETLPGGKVTITTKGDTLRSITDENGQSVALRLPINQEGKTVGEALLLPELRIALPTIGNSQKTKTNGADNIAGLAPEHLTCEPQKLSFGASPQAKKWESNLKGSVSYTAEDLLRLPAVTTRNKVILVGQDPQLCRMPARGEERGGMIFYSPELKIRYDLRRQVIARILHFANLPHSSSAQKKHNPHSLAGTYYIVNRILEVPEKKRAEAVRQYANLFADEKFASFCEKELSYMTKPYRGGVSGKGTRIEVEPKVMEQLMVINFRDIQLCLCERLTQEARTEFSHLLQEQQNAAVAGKELVLREVQMTDTDELIWLFEVSSGK